MSESPAVGLAGLEISDPPERWRALGFSVGEHGEFGAGEVWVTLGVAPPGRGIVGWTLAGLERDGDIDGLATRRAARRRASGTGSGGRNGVVGIDHLVIATPDLERLAAILERRGLALTRRREVRGRAMGFRRLAPEPGRRTHSGQRGSVLEIVQAPEAPATAFWGVTFAVSSPAALDALTAENRFVGEARPAVQPGRRIAAVSAEARLSTHVAFIVPDPP